MKRLVTTFALAIAVAISSSGSYASAAKHLRLVATTAEREQFIAEADTPVLVLKVGKQCKRCAVVESMLAKKAATYPHISIVKVDIGVDTPHLDFWIPITAELAFTIDDFNYDEKSVDAFLKARDNFARDYRETDIAANRLNDKIIDIGHGFYLREKAIDDEAHLALKADYDAAEALHPKARLELNYFYRARLSEMESGRRCAREKLQPYDVIVATIHEQEKQATDSLNAELAAKKEKLHQLIASEKQGGK